MTKEKVEHMRNFFSGASEDPISWDVKHMLPKFRVEADVFKRIRNTSKNSQRLMADAFFTNLAFCKLLYIS